MDQLTIRQGIGGGEHGPFRVSLDDEATTSEKRETSNPTPKGRFLEAHLPTASNHLYPIPLSGRRDQERRRGVDPVQL